jgi:hypothetical protein
MLVGFVEGRGLHVRCRVRLPACRVCVDGGWEEEGRERVRKSERVRVKGEG